MASQYADGFRTSAWANVVTPDSPVVRECVVVRNGADTASIINPRTGRRIAGDPRTFRFSTFRASRTIVRNAGQYRYTGMAAALFAGVDALGANMTLAELLSHKFLGANAPTVEAVLRGHGIEVG